MWSVVCARNPITIGSNPVYLINETNIEKGGDAMDYAVFQDCVKSMDLRQRFQKLQDEIYILNKNRELVPNLEWDQRYARAYAQLWQQIRQRIKVIQKRMLA